MSELVLKIQNAQGSSDALEQLINEYQSFILACASRTVNHFVTKSDDEWSVALIAFNEAVQNYDSTKGDFRGFSNLIIRRRLTDHLKKEYRHMNEVPTEPIILQGGLAGDEDETAGEQALQSAGVSFSNEVPINTTAWPGQYSISDEIEAVRGLLSNYGFSFFDVADSTPKAAKTRFVCAKATAVMLKTPEFLSMMKETGNLPVSKLAAVSGVKKKILERHRRYIIAAVVILDGDYPLLAEYMRNVKEEVGRL